MRYSIALILVLLWGPGSAGDQSSGIGLAEKNPKPSTEVSLEVINDMDFKSSTHNDIEKTYQKKNRSGCRAAF